MRGRSSRSSSRARVSSASTPSSTRRITVRAVNPLAPLATPTRVSAVKGDPVGAVGQAVDLHERLFAGPVDPDDPGEAAGLGHLPQGGGQATAHCSLPSSTVARPRRNVATTRPGSSMPAYGVLRLRLADSVASTTRRTAGS